MAFLRSAHQSIIVKPIPCHTRYLRCCEFKGELNARNSISGDPGGGEGSIGFVIEFSLENSN